VNRRTFLGLAPFAALAAAELPKHPRELKFAPRQYTPPKGADYQHKLSNGATAFLVEDHDFPLISVSIMIRTGQYLEPHEKAGLASFTGSQMRSGGTLKRSPSEFDEEAAFLAASIGSSIGDVSGSAGLNCLAKDIDAGLALFVEMLRTPGFAEDRLKLAKSQTLQAMERRNDRTPEIEAREFARLMRGDHFSAWEETKSNIEAITRQDLIDFHKRYYYPANFVFAVSGDFETKQMLSKLESAFGNWPSPRMAVPPVPKPAHKPVPGVYVVNKPDVNQGRVRMGHLGVTISNPDHLGLSIMNGILGGDAFTSRITERVRSDEGLAYSAGSAFPAGTYYEGIFSAGFQSKTATVAQAIDIVIEEINKMRDTKVKPEELQTAVNRAVEALPLRFATSAAKAGQFASDFYTNMPADYWQQYTPKLRALTADDLQRVAQKYLHPEQLVILAVGNVEGMLKGNPDRPQHSLEKIAGAKGVVRIPLPDPLTMVYPSGA
jgi:predicted Zn-dependent peptidase